MKNLDKNTRNKVNKNGFDIGGLLYYQENKNFQRLPKGLLIDEGMDKTKTHSSGAYIDFTSNCSSITVHVKLKEITQMSHFSTTASSGLDLYVLHEERYIYLGTTKSNKKDFSYTFIKGMPRSQKQFRLYLPTYVELLDLEIEINKSAEITYLEKPDLPKIICYGTSITQGGCSSRSAMTYPSIMGRKINSYEVINFGFSGSAHLQIEIANLIKDVNNLSVLIIEVEANAGDESGVLTSRLEPFIKTIIDAKPDLKIFLVSHFPYSHILFSPSKRAKFIKHKHFQKEISKKYSKNIEFVDGELVLNELNYEETVDTIHLNDLGFLTLAEYFINKISKKTTS